MKKIIALLLLISGVAFGQSTTQPQRAMYGSTNEIQSYPGLSGMFIRYNFNSRTFGVYAKDATDTTSPASDSVIVSTTGVRFKLLTDEAGSGGGGGGGSVAWNDVTGKPSTFTPATHNQAISTVTGLQDSLNARQATITLGTSLQYYRGDKTWATLDNAAVRLGNVQNVDQTNASNLTSGTIAAGRFGALTVPVSAMNASGTAGSGTFLRGDGVWASPSSSAVTSVAGRTGTITLTTSDISGLGTAATFNVPASGNAGTTEVVRGNDTRLTGLTANLAAKSDTSHRHSAAHLTSGTIPAARYATGTIPVLALNATGSTADTAVLRRNGTWAVISGGGGSSGLSDPGSNGMLSRTASGTTTSRTLSASGDGLSVTNGTGVSGNPTYSLANDAAAIEALTGTGIPKRTGTDTWSLGAVDLSGAEATGTMAAARMPALTGDIVTTAGAVATTYNNVVPANKGGAGSVSGLMKANGSGTVSAAVAGTDYVVPSGNITGTAANITGTAAIANGGTGSTTASGARTNLGATTIGGNMFTLANPSAVTFPRFNADNTVTALDAATFRSAIGAGTSSTTGTVTSVAMTAPTGFTISGSPVTSSGTLALSYTTGLTANQFLATPNGSTGAMALRSIVAADIPTLNQNTTGTAANLSGTPTLPNGTAATTQSASDNTTKIATTAFVQTLGNGRVLAVDNVATLKTITGVAGQIVTTKGYYADGDGGGNTYYWNTSSTTAKDSGSVFQVHGVTTGRWLSVEQREVFSKRWGAKGDGSNDDTAYLKSALTYAINNSKNFTLTEGDYKVTANLYNTENNTGTKNLYIRLVGNVKITVPTGNSEINTALIVYGHQVTTNVSITGGSLLVELNNKCRGFLEIRNNGIVGATYYTTTGGNLDISANSVTIREAYAGSGSDKSAYGIFILGSFANTNIQNVVIDSVRRDNSSGGECKGIAIQSTRGLVSVSNCRISNVLAPASYLVDADGLTVFGMQEDVGVTNSIREAKAVISNCIFTDNQGRHVKFQTSDATVINCKFERKMVVGITAGHDIDFQFGNGVVLNNTFAYKKNGATSPLGGSFIPVMFQEILTNRNMHAIARDNVFYTEVELRSPFYIITTTSAYSAVVEILKNKVISILTLTGSANINRGFCEFNSAEVQAITGTLTISLDGNSCFSGNAPLLSYNSVSTTDLTTKLIFRLTNNTNENTAQEPRAFAPISGSNITATNKYQIFANSGYRADLTGTWVVNLNANRILPPSEFVIDLGTNTVTNGPTMGSSGYATVKVMAQWNGGQPVTEIYERTGGANDYLHISMISGTWKKATLN